MLIVYVKVTNHMFNEKKRNVIKESGNILWFRIPVKGIYIYIYGKGERRGRKEIIQFLFIIIYESLKHDVITMRKHQKGYKKKVKILNIHTHILTTMTMMMMLYDLLVYYNLNYTTYSIATTITLIERVWFNGMIPCYNYYYHNLFFLFFLILLTRLKLIVLVVVDKKTKIEISMNEFSSPINSTVQL